MKLNPGMHIVMHLVSFGKAGVTILLLRGPRFQCGPAPPLGRREHYPLDVMKWFYNL
jgi:hypothetical protein